MKISVKNERVTMLYTQFGNTDKIVSRLGFGTNRFQQKHLQDEEGLHQCAEVVRYASSRGINYFDTGFNYDSGKSEAILGLAFKDMANPFFVSSKSSIHYDKTSDDVLRRIEASLHAMELERISFYLMWGIMNRDHYVGLMKKGGPYEGLVRAKERGLIEHICCSTHAQPDVILDIINDGYYEGITISFNAMTAKKLQPCLAAAYEKKIALISMNSLGGGAIPGLPAFFESLKLPEDDDVATAALRFNVSHKELTVALSGMGLIEEVEKNVRAVESEACISEERTKRFMYADNPVFDSFCTGCKYCLPCPVGIDINKYMTAYNYNYYPDTSGATVNKESRNPSLVLEKMRVRYGAAPDIDGNPCRRCGLCEQRCPMQLSIISCIDEMHGWPQKEDDVIKIVEQDGFYDKEQGGVWIKGDAGIVIKSNTAKRFSIIAQAPPNLNENLLSITINNRESASLSLVPGENKRMDISFENNSGIIRVGIKADKTFTSLENGKDSDKRELGAYIVSWRLFDS